MIYKLSKIQKNLAENALKVLKKDGIMIYSTCTHGPEENEEIIDYLLNKYPIELQEGMTFALETYCPAKDGSGAARIEEECVVTEKGCRVMTKYPCDELICIEPSFILTIYVPMFIAFPGMLFDTGRVIQIVT